MEKTRISTGEYILRLFFPPRCICCDMLLELNTPKELCRECRQSLPVLSRNRFSNPVGDSIGNVFSAFDYDQRIRTAIHNMKFKDSPGNAAVLIELSFPILKGFLVYEQPLFNTYSKYDIILPVPIHIKRKRERGYNQSELLAKNLAKRMNAPVNNKILVKIRNTPPQSSLGRGERLTNLKKAFQVKHKNLISGCTVLLVDDVMTTGSTIEHCGKVLTEAGALQVDAFVVAIRQKFMMG